MHNDYYIGCLQAIVRILAFILMLTMVSCPASWDGTAVTQDLNPEVLIELFFSLSTSAWVCHITLQKEVDLNSYN